MLKTKKTIPFPFKLIAGFIILIASFIVAMVFGAANISITDLWFALSPKGTSESINIIREIRLPREVGAIVVGAALSVSGAIMQGLTRNPLADPGLLGLTAGANAALALTLAFIPSASYLVLTIVCFIGAAVGTVMVFGISALKRGGFSPLRMVLAGAAVTAFLDAIAQGISLTFKISKDVSLWTAGGLVGTAWNQLVIIVPFIVAGILISVLFSRQLTLLSLSQELAVGLGQKVTLIKLILFIVVILLAGSSVALVGNMAFIGLMIPHMIRPFTGTDYRYVIPMSALFGASFMSIADTLGRTINAPYETPVAAIIAVLGLPFFLFVVRKGVKAFS